MFNPRPVPIKDVLNASVQYAIPLYQRDYRWGKGEAADLIEDLKNYQDSDRERLFLGNFIFEKPRDRRILVVDGQQRLTTLILLLVACRARARELKLEQLATVILDKIAFIDPTTGESRGCRLIASDSIQKVFALITEAAWDGTFPPVIDRKQVKRQSKRLKPIYDYFLEQVSALDRDGLSKFLGAIYEAFVTQIDIESEEDALNIFERTNARGMELAISDLLKTHLFAKKVPGIEDRWTQIVTNAGGTILRMLKYFYVSRSGHVNKPQLYKRLKEYAGRVTPDHFTTELLEFSQFFHIAGTPDKPSTKRFFEEKGCDAIHKDQGRYERIAFSLQALREFGVTQFCPPAYAAIESLGRTGGGTGNAEAKALVRLFETFERYHFINNAICDRVGNEVEMLYAEASEAYANKDFMETTQGLIQDLRKQVAGEEEFVARFCDLSYSSDTLSLLWYIFDRWNNYGRDISQWLPIYDPTIEVRRRLLNIEHWFPQKPEDPELRTKRATLDQVDNIGNLLWISYKTNSRLGNGTPAEKLAALKGPLAAEIENLVYIKAFMQQYGNDAENWDKRAILRRAADMARCAYEQMWRIE